jgi:ComF family protein
VNDPASPLSPPGHPHRATAWCRSLGSRLVDVLYPSRCALCMAPGTPLCEACRADSALPAPTCALCAIPLAHAVAGARCGRCLRRSPRYDATVAAALYAAPFDQLLRRFKYGAALAYAPLFADLLAPQCGRLALDAVVPLPLSRERTAARGFNQAVEIARPLARRLGVPLVTDAVLRIVDTAPQAGLRFDERRRNVRRAFCTVDAAARRLAGRTIGVVDDVMTTGATLDEFARTLKRAGVARIVNLVVARTPL